MTKMMKRTVGVCSGCDCLLYYTDGLSRELMCRHGLGHTENWLDALPRATDLDAWDAKDVGRFEANNVPEKCPRARIYDTVKKLKEL